MHKVFHHMMVAAALLMSSQSYGAFSVKAYVTSDSVRWDNAYMNGSSLVPMWTPPPNIATVISWAGATFSVAPPTSVTVGGGSGRGEASEPIPVEFIGMQYNTMGIDYTESSSVYGGGGCDTDKVEQPIVTVEGGQGCISSTQLNYENVGSIQPFVLYRPIFNMSDEDIIAAFEGRSSGTYSNFISIISRYYYTNQYGINTYRNLTETMTFTFEYDPVQLKSVTVAGDGVMEPDYDTSEKRVSSETNFQITAEGYFDDGLVLTMPRQTYALANAESGLTIPYSITCNECSGTTLVDEGVLNESNRVTTIAQGTGEPQTSIQFNLNFDYEVDGEDLVSGTYQDAVTIMIEPGI